MQGRRHAGYSLVEVLIAIAITGIVLLTIVTLFYMGKRNVYAGKQMTVANSVGTRVLEDLAVMTAEDLRLAFNMDDSIALNTVTLNGVPPGSLGANASGQLQFANSWTVETSGCTRVAGNPSATPPVPSTWDCGVNDPKGYLGKWWSFVEDPDVLVGANVKQNQKLANPVLGVIVTPRDPVDVNSKVMTAQYFKVRVYLQWDEQAKGHRFAFFDTTKVNRQ